MFDFFLNQTIPQLLAERSSVTFIAIFVAGILTSISPCVLSMVPVLIGYVGGYSEPSRVRAFLLSLSLVLGMATTFTVLGVVAVSLGTIFGQIGIGWYYFVAVVSIIMGLNLLGVINLRFPVPNVAAPKIGGIFGAYLVGLLFGIMASSCATPVLVAILAVVTTAGDITTGAGLLFFYGLGHGMPLVLIGTFTGLLKEVSRVARFTQYLNIFSGLVLILLGLYLLYIAN